jgi:hypothetical protein
MLLNRKIHERKCTYCSCLGFHYKTKILLNNLDPINLIFQYNEFIISSPINFILNDYLSLLIYLLQIPSVM